MRKLLFVALIAISAHGVAQIPNAGFESGTSNEVTGWQIHQSAGGIFPSRAITAKTGDSTISAYEGDSFLVLEHEDGKDKAGISTGFPLKDRKATLTARVIYLPQDYRQRFQITMTYTRNNGGNRDTVMHQVSLFTTTENNGELNHDWLRLIVRADEQNFRMNGDPDSCFIHVKVDATKSSRSAVLMMDDMEFTTALVAGIRLPAQSDVHVYPTIASNSVFVESQERIQSLLLLDGSGRLLRRLEPGSRSYRMEVGSLPEGYYYIQVRTDETVSRKRFLKSF